MRRVVAVLVFLLPWAATAAAHPDPLFDFKLTGDGHTYEFVTPNPPPVYDHPHAIQVFLSNLPGTEDGMSGYLFNANVTVDSRGGVVPTITLSVLPPGNGTQISYNLSGPPITSATYVPVAYNPIYSFGSGYQNLVISNFLPGDYAFSAYWGQNIEDFEVSIMEEDSPVVTPEPATWVLLATGAVGAVATFRRRGSAVHA